VRSIRPNDQTSEPQEGNPIGWVAFLLYALAFSSQNFSPKNLFSFVLYWTATFCSFVEDAFTPFVPQTKQQWRQFARQRERAGR
jgi:hypothetical protein